MATHLNTRATLLVLAAAVLANGAAGLLYVWSLFILPIEGALMLNRADLGLISSLALISFTLGVSLLPIILERTGRVAVAILCFTMIGGGHILFGIFPSWGSLAIGYGLGFGVGSGIAYGFALSLAASLPTRIRAPAIGLALGAFALSGIVLPVVLGNWIATTAPSLVFLQIGIGVLAVGALCVMTLLGMPSAARVERGAPVAAAGQVAVDRPFLILSLIFFFICFNGLSVISQAAAIASAAGIGAAGYAATTLTMGYLVGSLFGAPLAEKAGERVILLLLASLSFLGVVAMLTEVRAALFMGSGLIGITFGGSGSIMPMLLGVRYGAENISRLYGRMIIAYGVAGLVAPGIAGFLFEGAQSYAPMLLVCATFAALAFGAAIVLQAQSSMRDLQRRT